LLRRHVAAWRLFRVATVTHRRDAAAVRQLRTAALLRAAIHRWHVRHEERCRGRAVREIVAHALSR
jgi:hypothetical protein